MTTTYDIGTPGTPWGEAEKTVWFSQQRIKRSYLKDVVARIELLKPSALVEQYASLIYGDRQYPLFAIKVGEWHADKPTCLVTGGVHGYETSGVHGALRFVETHAVGYSAALNILVLPCVSPWGYETINRWNPKAIDPNRSFVQNSPAQESAAVMTYLAQLGVGIDVHIDLHETTDTDNSEFRPALGARDGSEQDCWNIPDGFYLVGSETQPEPAFQSAILQEVEKVTHIAEADDSGKIIGATLAQRGVINYPTQKLGLCAGMTNARYTTTTEVYPDSPQASPEICIRAQVAAIVGGLNYVLAQGD